MPMCGRCLAKGCVPLGESYWVNGCMKMGMGLFGKEKSE